MSRLTGTCAAGKGIGELHGGIAADGMTDNGDRLPIVAVTANGLIRYTAPAHVGVSALLGRDAAAVNALRQFVHAPIDRGDQTIKQIGASVNGGRGLFGASSRDEAGRDQGRRDTACGISEDVFGSNHRALRFGTV